MSLFALTIILIGAFFIDGIVGDPPNRYHPVAFIGYCATKVECLICSLGRSCFIGAIAYLFMIILPLFLVSSLTFLLDKYFGLYGTTVFITVLLSIFFAPFGLAKHARAVESKLVDGNIKSARVSLSMMVGRETANLDNHGVIRATIESVAENLTDGVLAPIFWVTIGYMTFGPVGSASLLVLYRVTNTLDSMWGHKNERYGTFGTVAAKMDDLLNFFPARIALLSTAVAAMHRSFYCRKCWHIGMRDGKKHESPNAGWTEAAFAGALGLQLNGPVIYDGVVVEHSWLGDGTKDATVSDILRAINLMWFSASVFTLLMMFIFWIMLLNEGMM